MKISDDRLLADLYQQLRLAHGGHLNKGARLIRAQIMERIRELGVRRAMEVAAELNQFDLYRRLGNREVTP